MKKIVFLVLLLNTKLFSFQTVSSYNIAAFVKFVVSDSTAPVIEHQKLERISEITKVAKIKAIFKDNIQLSEVAVYYSSSPSKSIFEKSFTPGTTFYDMDVFIEKDVINPPTFYYRLMAFDGTNHTYLPSSSSWFEVKVDKSEDFTFSQSGGEVIFRDGNPDDGELSLIYPEGAVDKNVSLKIEEMNPSEFSVSGENFYTKNPVSVFKFSPDMEFGKSVTLKVPYLDVDNDGKIDGTDCREELATVFSFDGFDWRNCGGEVDTENNTVSLKINHLSIYGIFLVKYLSESVLKPREKFITPGVRDGKNDKIVFDGLNNLNTEVKIFDLWGRVIRKINSFPYEWDGRDDEGRLVNPGVYVYQYFHPELNKRITGVVIVAR